MQNKIISPRELKHRKMLFVLPIVMLPFLTMLFWTFGGGKGSVRNIGAEDKMGFNVRLPNARFKQDSTLNKMSYYEKATIDSLKLQDQIKKDPNYSRGAISDDSSLVFNELETDPAIFQKGNRGLNTSSFKGESQQRMYQKLEALQRAIAAPVKVAGRDQDMGEFEYGNSSRDALEKMKSVEQMISAINSPPEPDPELRALGGMLENILDIQHPERVQEKLRQTSKAQKGKVFAVSKKNQEESVSLLESPGIDQSRIEKGNAFYSLDQPPIYEQVQNALEGVVHQTQSIVNGSIVKLRLTSDVFINGVLIAKNNFVFGTAFLKGERLEVKIKTIRLNTSIFPVELSVYDMDGIEGIFIPGAINRDVSKISADRSMQSLGIEGLNDSWGAQAAGLGVEAAKSLLSKKIKLIKVVLKAGYQVLLYDQREKNAK